MKWNMAMQKTNYNIVIIFRKTLQFHHFNTKGENKFHYIVYN